MDIEAELHARFGGGLEQRLPGIALRRNGRLRDEENGRDGCKHLQAPVPSPAVAAYGV
jgi:hypothetical protein